MGENSNGGGIDPISAIANAAGSLFSAIGSIFTSSNQVDIEQAKVTQIEEQIKLEQTKGENELLIQALKNKQTTANADLLAAKSEQNAKTIKTGIFGAIGAMVLFFVYKIISKSTPDMNANPYQPINY